MGRLPMNIRKQVARATELAEQGQRNQRAVGMDLIQPNGAAFKCPSTCPNTGTR